MAERVRRWVSLTPAAGSLGKHGAGPLPREAGSAELVGLRVCISNRHLWMLTLLPWGPHPEQARLKGRVWQMIAHGQMQPCHLFL